MPDILDYTLAQVFAFARAADRQRRNALKDLAVATRAAQADAKGWKAYVREIDGKAK